MKLVANVFIVLIATFILAGLPALASADAPVNVTSVTITSNLTAHYSINGSVNISWSEDPTKCGSIANVTLWVSSDNGATWTKNSTNVTTDNQFDGINGNWSFRLQPWNGTGVEGTNYTYNESHRWLVIDKTLPTGFTLSENAALFYDEGYVTANWTQPAGLAPVNNYTIWISTNKGTTYTQNGSNTSGTGFDFHLIEANYTARLQWVGGADGDIFTSENMTWANGSYWFQIDKTGPVITAFSCSNAPLGQTVTCSCSATDALSGVASVSYYSTVVASALGTNSQTCTATDNVGMSTEGTAYYEVAGTGGGGQAVVQQPSASKSWGSISPGKSASMIVDEEGIDFTKFEIGVKERVSNPRVKIELLAEEPSCDGTVLGSEFERYQYVKITASNLADSNLDSASGNFRVNQTWMSQNNINKASVSLYRCANGEWVSLQTSMVEEDDEHAYYQSNIPGFSYFIIAAAEEGQTVCDNDGTCEPTQGETFDNCPNDCPEGTITCTPGTLQCFGDDLKQCDSEGTNWELVETCQHGCSDGECQAAAAADSTWLVVALIIVVVVVLLFVARMLKFF